MNPILKTSVHSDPTIGRCLKAEEILSQLPGIIAWKDTASRYLGGNRAAVELSGFKKIEEMLGVSDYEVKESIAECAELFVEQDKKVMKENKDLSVLGVHLYSDDTKRTLLTQKSPLKGKEDNIVGIIFNCTIITDDFLVELGRQLLKTDSKYLGILARKQNSYVLESKYDKKLTERESVCLFYLIRGKSASEIGQMLNISKRTVESHIENIKIKMNCEKKSSLIEKSLWLGYLNILPKALINKNLSISLKG